MTNTKTECPCSKCDFLRHSLAQSLKGRALLESMDVSFVSDANGDFVSKASALADWDRYITKQQAALALQAETA